MGGIAGSGRRTNFRLLAWVTAALLLGACSLIPWLFMALDRDDVEASESPLAPRGWQADHGWARRVVWSLWRWQSARSHPLPRSTTGWRPMPRCSGRWKVLAFGLSKRHSPLVARSLAWRLGAGACGRFFASRVFRGAASDRRLVGRAAGGGDPGTRRPVRRRPSRHARSGDSDVGGWSCCSGASEAKRPNQLKLLCAFACFGAAACVKQQFVVTPGVSAFLLASAWRAKRVRFGTLVGALLCDASVLFLYYGAEIGITQGRVADVVYRAKRLCLFVGSPRWPTGIRFYGSMLVLCWKCVGLILLLAASALAVIPARAG